MGILLRTELIIGHAGGSRTQRFFALLRAADWLPLDAVRAFPRAVVVPLFAFMLLFAPAFFFPEPFGLADARRPVATSSCRCSEPIIRPSDSAERSNSDSSSRDRSRDGEAGMVFLAIPCPFSRA